MNKQTHVNFEQPLTMKELEHLVSCDFCVEQFADYIEEQELIRAPRYLQEEILKRSQQFEVQIVAKSNQASKKLQLFYYSLKVGFAAVFALAFLMAAPALASPTFHSRIPTAASQHSQEQKNTFRIYDGAQKITDRLADFTNQLYKMEVTPHDKQEK